MWGALVDAGCCCGWKLGACRFGWWPAGVGRDG